MGVGAVAQGNPTRSLGESVGQAAWDVVSCVSGRRLWRGCGSGSVGRGMCLFGRGARKLSRCRCLVQGNLAGVVRSKLCLGKTDSHTSVHLRAAGHWSLLRRAVACLDVV